MDIVFRDKKKHEAWNAQTDKYNDIPTEYSMPAEYIAPYPPNNDPMLPYCNGLKIFKILGLPLTVHVDKDIKFEEKHRALKCCFTYGDKRNYHFIT